MDETQLPSVDLAQQPSYAPPPPRDPDKLRALGAKLAADFIVYETDRRIAEMRWTQNLRQFLGQYDDKVKSQIPSDRSLAYPRLTRVKCVSMLARLMNLLFPSSEKNWGIEASPVPNLSVEDLNYILEQLQQPDEQGQQPELTDDMITDAVREFAKSRAKNLEIEIEDQLTELGGAKMVSYVALVRKVLASGILYSMGVLKGPMARSRQQRRWKLDPAAGKVIAVDETILVPQYEFCPVWDYYPDMSAKYIHQMDGQFQRIVMSRAQVRKLADDSQFFGDVIKKYLKDHREGNYKEKNFESELRTMGVNTNQARVNGRKYEILVWDGGLSGHYLKGCGIDIPDTKLHEMISAVVWILDGQVIRANLNPWAIVGEDNPIPSYHVFIFEEDDTSLVGNGLPFIMRDSQLGVAATARMVLDNAGVVCGPNIEVNRQLLVPETDVDGVTAYKAWERDDESPATLAYPAVRTIQFDSHIDELLKVNELFRNFADQETFVGPATGGDMPSEPLRTASGASMFMGKEALPFKDVVRNFDSFTESVMGSLILFNKHFNGKQSIKGDFQPVSRGSTSLIAKEVRGMGYDELARSVTPGEQLYVDWHYLLKERVAVRDMDPRVIVDDAEAKRREEAQAQSQQKKEQQSEEMIRATVRKTLADAVKSLTQGDKNAAASDATIYTAILTGLEKGVTPAEVAEVKTNPHADIPDGVLTKLEVENQPPPTPAPKSPKKGK
jgi:hypothetical protein